MGNLKELYSPQEVQAYALLGAAQRAKEMDIKQPWLAKDAKDMIEEFLWMGTPHTIALKSITKQVYFILFGFSSCSIKYIPKMDNFLPTTLLNVLIPLHFIGFIPIPSLPPTVHHRIEGMESILILLNSVAISILMQFPFNQKNHPPQISSRYSYIIFVKLILSNYKWNG